MATATLLLREPAVTSLTSIVEKSQLRKPPLPEFDLRLNSCQLDFVLKPDSRPRISADEGFESDVDTLSIVSSDDSVVEGSKTQETDSANGSASSDSDTETLPVETPPPKVEPTSASSESYHLVDCMCYTDIKFPNILVFVAKGDALVFRFENLEGLQKFYASFSTFKAIANQKAYSKNFGARFNLLQRTDKNGITHIEITKEPETRLAFAPKSEPSSIISLNTPESSSYYRSCREGTLDEQRLPFSTHKESRSNLKDANARQRSESPLGEAQSRKEGSHGSKVLHAVSTEDMLDLPSPRSGKREGTLRKVWNSAEDLLDSSKRPERRRKPKPRAPPPPDVKNSDVLKGQYVRVNVTSADIKPSEVAFTRPFSTGTRERLHSFTQKMLPARDFSLTLKPKETSFQQFKFVEPKRVEIAQNRLNENSWTYSVPRFLKKPRSHSETRNFTPMAYRYIDTTQSGLYYGGRGDTSTLQVNPSNVSNRLFGMSSKLKDFSSVSGGTMNKRYESWEGRNDIRRGSLGELTYKINSTGGSLKSVIKKDDTKRRNNEKKVTFSAYTTVQVV